MKSLSEYINLHLKEDLTLDEAITLHRQDIESYENLIAYYKSVDNQVSVRAYEHILKREKQTLAWLEELAEYHKLFESPKEAEDVLNMLSV